MKKKRNKNSIPKKNYLILAGIILGVIAVFFYFYMWYDVYTENKFSESYLVKEKTIVHTINNLSEIESVLSDSLSENYFIYVTYTKSKDVYKLEESLKPIIEEYNLKNTFYLLDVTDILDEPNYLDKINSSLRLEENKVTQIPTIIYFQNQKVTKDSIITREDKNIMQAGDFSKLLDIKRIEKN